MFDIQNMQTQPTGLQTACSAAEFGAIFRHERKAQGLTQAQVAGKIGCRRQTVADLEAGRNVTSLIVFNALSAIGKQIQVCAKGGIDLENVRDFLGPDWDD